MGARVRVGATSALLLLFMACGGGGCPGEPGGECTPNDTECRGDFYCAIGGVCTKVCESDAACKPGCEDDQDCGASNGDARWTCLSGGCSCVGDGCAPEVRCYGGYCQRECAQEGTCGYDPYVPRR